jgi:hypothetical protein
MRFIFTRKNQTADKSCINSYRALKNCLAPVALILVLVSCSPESEEQPASTVSFFQSDIAPLLVSGCATCHLTGAEAGNMSLVPDKIIKTLVNVKAVGAPTRMRVVPGKPDDSYLIMKIEGTHISKGGSGTQMPFGAPPLSADKIAKLRKWILEGAKA